MFRLSKKKTKFFPALAPRDVGVIIAGLAVFVALAASTVTKFSIWFDEAFGSYLIRFDYAALTRYTAYDVHPPLYYWLLKTWSLVFGNTELGLRSMSIFFGAMTILFAFLLVIRLFGRKAAYISLVFLVLSPLFVRYSQEARMYTLLTAIIVAATYVLMYAHETKKRWAWVMYGVLLALGMLTQYFAALAWLAHWAWRFIVVRREKGSLRKNFFAKDWLIAHAVAIGLFVPWLPWLVRQFADVQGNGFWIPPISSATIPDFLTDFLLFTEHDDTKSWLAAGFYVVLAATVWLIIKTTGRLTSGMRDSYVLMVCMVVVPVVLLALISLPPLRPAFIDRYVMGVIVFLPILIGVGLAHSGPALRRWMLVGFGGLVAALMIVGLYNQSVIGNYNKSTKQSNDVRQLIEQVRQQSPHNQPIVAATPWIFYEAAIYMRADSPIYFVNETTTYEFGSLRMLQENDDHKIMNLDDFTKKNPSFWMIANIKGGDVKPLRTTWQVNQTITINDDVSHTPLLRAIHVIVE